MNEQISRVITALGKNNMQGIYVPCINSIPKVVENLLYENAVISSGGSMSLIESGVWDLLNNGNYRFLDRNRQGITPEEQEDIYKSCIGADFYFCSANAVTEKGELVNVDGFANRISSIAFGPKKVVMVVGVNKIVKDVSEGLLRVKKIAAPKNCVRLGLDNPCVKLGHCVSLERCENPDFADGCYSDHRICAQYLISGKQREKNRITVIICGEPLGY